MNQYGFCGTRLGTLEKRAVGGAIRNVHGGTLCERCSYRQWKHRLLFAQCLLRVSAGQTASEVHSVTRLEPRYRTSSRFNCTRSVRAWSVRKRRFPRVRSCSHVGVRGVHAGGANPDHKLASAGPQIGDFLDAQYLRSSELGHANCFHVVSLTWIGTLGFGVSHFIQWVAVVWEGASRPLRSWKSCLICGSCRPVALSQLPNSRNVISAARTHSFALRGTLASGSQRKSCRETSKATTGPRPRAMLSSST